MPEITRSRHIHGPCPPRARQLPRPGPHRVQYFLHPSQLVVHRAHARLKDPEPPLHGAEPRIHAVKTVLDACEAHFDSLKPLLDADGAIVYFILAADERVELIVRANGECALGIAREANEDVV